MGYNHYSGPRDGYVPMMFNSAPNDTWTGPSVPRAEAQALVTPACARTQDPKYAAGQEKYRIEDNSDILFDMDTNLEIEGAASNRKFSSCGWFPIAHTLHPRTKTMVNIFDEWTAFTPKTVREMEARITGFRDRYDCANDREAKEWLVNHMDPKVKQRLLKKFPGQAFQRATFNVVWVEYASMRVGVFASARRDTFRDDIMKSTAGQVGSTIIPKRDMSLWADELQPRFDTYISAGGQFDFTLLIHVSKVAMTALPINPANADARIYHDTITKLVADVTKAVREVDSWVDEQEKRDYFMDKDIWCDQVLDTIKTAYETCKKSGGWSPAAGRTDSKTPGNHGVEANKLELNTNNSHGGGGRSGGGKGRPTQPSEAHPCKKCGSPTHWSRECPKNKNGGGGSNTNGKNNSSSSNKGGKGGSNNDGGKSYWKILTTPPKAGESERKKINGKWHEWCGLCSKRGKWVSSHSTATHRGRGNGGSSNGSSDAPTDSNFGLVEDACGWFAPFQQQPSDIMCESHLLNR